MERFDDTFRPGPLWSRVIGGHLGTGCGILGTGNSLYFSDEGTREARTIPLNLTNIKYVLTKLIFYLIKKCF